MTIRDCIVKAAGYLGIKETAEAFKNGTLTDDQGFMDMARDVIAEICSDYYPLKTTEKVMADKDGIIMFKNLKLPVIDVFRIIKNGVSIPFLIKYDRLEAGISGEVTVEYSYMPTLTSLDTKLPFSERLDARVIAFGIAAEYAVVNAPEDALLFDKRYKNALAKAIIQKGEKRVKSRNWL